MPGSYQRGAKRKFQRRKKTTACSRASTATLDEENQSDEEDSPALRKKVRWEGSNQATTTVSTEDDAAEGEDADSSENTESTGIDKVRESFVRVSSQL